jgi:hypothetical protein
LPETPIGHHMGETPHLGQRPYKDVPLKIYLE